MKSSAIVKKGGDGKAVKARKRKALPVLVNFILDKSGSMADVVDETISGVNTYVDKLKKDKKVRYLFTLTLFDTASVDMPYVAVPIGQVMPLTRDNYFPGAMTPLYDAVGNTVALVEKNGQTKNTASVLTVIMTDGYENASHEWTKEKIQKLIKDKEATGKWTFVFLGATLDAMVVGAALGTQPGNTAHYSSAHTAATVNAMAGATMCYAASATSAKGLDANMQRSFYSATKTVMPGVDDDLQKNNTSPVTTTSAKP